MVINNKLKAFLDQKYEVYNNPSFIQFDPICIPHQFTRKEDIEVAGFLTALISWGRRDQIIKSAKRLMQLMDNSPYDFITGLKEAEFKCLSRFVYRTFNADDLLFMVYALKNIYLNMGGLENLANTGFKKDNTVKSSISKIREGLMRTPHLKRSEKHVANPETGSAAKRINMFLRWMVRNDNKGVDFGIWKHIPAGLLMCPLDVHSGNVARKLGLLERKQNDWKAVVELTEKLKVFDNEDPVKYDFALFGLGVFDDL